MSKSNYQLDMLKHDLAYLERIKSGETDLKIGLCRAVSDINKEFLHCCFASWSLFSGCYTYPVPDLGNATKGWDTGRSPEAAAYNKALWSGSLWSTQTEYGRARHKLLDHCIAAFKIEIGFVEVVPPDLPLGKY